MREEITTQIAREELAGLLDASAGTAMRVTAEMAAVVDMPPDESLFEPAPPDESAGFVIRFNVKPAAKTSLQGYVVIGASFVLSIAAGIGLAAAIM